MKRFIVFNRLGDMVVMEKTSLDGEYKQILPKPCVEFTAFFGKNYYNECVKQKNIIELGGIYDD